MSQETRAYKCHRPTDGAQCIRVARQIAYALFAMKTACWFTVALLPFCPTVVALANEPAVPVTGTSVRLAMLRSVPKKWDLDGNFSVLLNAAARAADEEAQVFLPAE